MKKALLLASIIALLGLISCFTAPYIEADSVTITPFGGYAVDELTARIEGTLAGDQFVTIIWVAQASSTSQEIEYSTQYQTLYPDNARSNSWWIESTISAGYGYVFTGYFWVEVYDENYNLLIRSNKVYCYYD